MHHINTFYFEFFEADGSLAVKFRVYFCIFYHRNGCYYYIAVHSFSSDEIVRKFPLSGKSKHVRTNSAVNVILSLWIIQHQWFTYSLEKSTGRQRHFNHWKPIFKQLKLILKCPSTFRYMQTCSMNHSSFTKRNHLNLNGTSFYILILISNTNFELLFRWIVQ